VSVEVTDSGIGIAPEHHEKIFEDFRQVDDSPSRQYGGTGLGLAICRRLATSLGGRIALKSRVGKGSTFTLTIPTVTKQ
jgi:signal transduction histidine kinase